MKPTASEAWDTEPTDDRYAIGVKAMTQKWFVYDRITGEPVGPTYGSREAAISACDEANRGSNRALAR